MMCWFENRALLFTRENAAVVVFCFDRGTGHWLTDVSPLIPLLDGNRCTFAMKTAPWAMPWIASLNLRFSASNQTGKTSLLKKKLGR